MDGNVEIQREHYITNVLAVEDTSYYNLLVEEAIDIIDDVYKGSLTENSPKKTPLKQYISAPLYDHQQAMLHKMEEKEKELLSGPYYNEVGILGSGPSSGKTLTVLAHIAQCKQKGINDIIINKQINKHNKLYSYDIHNVIYNSTDPTMIIVPNNAYRSWIDQIRTHTFLQPLEIEKLSQINKLRDREYFANEMQEKDFVLVSDSRFNKFIDLLHMHDYDKFKRIYIDSPETIHITKNRLGVFNGFIWLITNSWYNFLPKILYYTSAYVRNAPPNLDEELKAELNESLHSTFFNANVKSHKFTELFMSFSKNNYKQVIRCRKSFIKDSMSIKDISSSSIICKITREQRALIPAITEKVSVAIKEKDISGAYNEMGVETIKLPTLLNRIKTIELEKLIHSQNVEEIINCNLRLQYIQERISEDMDCPVCFEKSSYTTYLPCCKQCVCGECALKLITPTCKMKCIYCRKYNSMKDIKLIGNYDQEQDITQTKFQQMCNYINSLPSNSKIVIFANKDYHFVELLDEFKLKNISPIFMRKSLCKRELNTNLINFHYGTTKKVMCIGENSIQETLNLSSATHVLTFYKLPYHVKDLLISRSNSSERHEPLQFVSFLYQDGIQDLSTLLIPGGDLY
jgi:hypothetical protein